MRRREFFVGVAATAAWPIGAPAQQGKLPSIALLGSGTPASQGQWVSSFLRRLRELGWVEGQTVAIEYRWAEGSPERFVQIADEFARTKPTVIFALGTEAAIAAKRATSDIPIIFPLASDPVATGLVASLSRPGGNVTGLSNQAADLPAKRFGLLREVIPSLRRVGIMANANGPGATLEMKEGMSAAKTLGLEVVALEIRDSEDITASFATFGEA